MSATAAEPDPISRFLRKLSEIQIGTPSGLNVRKKDMVCIFRNLATLLENGLSLSKSVTTLRNERSLRRYEKLFESIERHVNQGSTMSAALTTFQGSFDELLINQIRIGERSGTLPDTIRRIADQLERGSTLRKTLVKKLTYPCLLSTAGAGAMTFMMLCVVPTFEDMYADSGAELPQITQILITVGAVLSEYGTTIAIGLALTISAAIATWRHPAGRLWIDRALLRVPLLESCLRNIAVLQFTQVLGNLLECGFTLADALPHTSKGISNSVVRNSVQDLHAAIRRGERFSRELERRSDIFPPIVTQLVIIGERTGTLTRATRQIREHLHEEVDRYTNALIGAIEPVLTIGLAAAIGGILLAVYLPMFDMIGAVNQ